jgi:hypothetical protein
MITYYANVPGNVLLISSKRLSWLGLDYPKGLRFYYLYLVLLGLFTFFAKAKKSTSTLLNIKDKSLELQH